MVDQLTKGFGGDLVPTPNDPRHNPNTPLEPEASRATPEDEAAATDLLGRTNDGPVAVNRDLPPSADHYDRDQQTEA